MEFLFYSFMRMNASNKNKLSLWGFVNRSGSMMQDVALDSGAMDRFRRFDEAYYHRFYENPVTRVHSAEEHANLAQFVFAFSRWNKLEVKTVLDIGAGVGLWKDWIAKNEIGRASW